jgi:hypothetical protein
MNKKGIVTIVVIIVLVAIGYFVWGGKSTSTVSNTDTNAPATTQPAATTDSKVTVSKDTYVPVTKDSTDNTLLGKLKSASVSAAETGARVALVNGAAQFTVDNTKGSIALGDIALSTQSGQTKYAITSLAVNTGGSGSFQYVVLFEDAGSTLNDKSYAFIGDRVKITGIRADSVTGENGKSTLVVSVSYLDHAKGEALSAAPKEAHTKLLVVEDGVFNAGKELTL